MGSRDDFKIAHWDPEPKAPASRSHSKRFAKWQNAENRATAFGVRGACSRFCRRLKERDGAWTYLSAWTAVALRGAGKNERALRLRHSAAIHADYFRMAGFKVQACSFATSRIFGARKPSLWITQPPNKPGVSCAM